MTATSATSGPRPYESLLAKGEDRKQRILTAAEALLARNGWRNTSLAQIAREAGVSAAGLLHHFESKEALLHAVLDARDFDDDTHADRGGDLIANIGRVAERFHRAPALVGTFTVLLVENIQPDAPLHDRLVASRPPSRSWPTPSGAGRPTAATAQTSTRPPRPWRSSPSSMEWRPHGYSILRFPSPTCSRATPRRWFAISLRR